MTPYLDAGFLLTLLIPTNGTAVARHVLRDVRAPFDLNFLHQLQAENLLKAMEASPERERQRAGRQARGLWERYFAEGVFQLSTPTAWDTAFVIAIAWNDSYSTPPPPPLLLLHPALAAVGGATDFFSFDPRSRTAAKAADLRVRPERL